MKTFAVFLIAFTSARQVSRLMLKVFSVKDQEWQTKAEPEEAFCIAVPFESPGAEAAAGFALP